jgi:hypothetical protein
VALIERGGKMHTRVVSNVSQMNLGKCLWEQNISRQAISQHRLKEQGRCPRCGKRRRGNFRCCFRCRVKVRRWRKLLRRKR